MFAAYSTSTKPAALGTTQPSVQYILGLSQG